MSQPTYTRISEITTEDLVDYLRLPDVDSAQLQLLTTLKAAAVSYIVGVTNLKLEDIDKYPDLTVAFLALVQDMYDNRAIYVDKRNISDTVSTILNMYRTNLL